MAKYRILLLSMLAFGLLSKAEQTEIKKFNYYGPIGITEYAVLGDTSKLFKQADILDLAINDKGLPYEAIDITATKLPTSDQVALNILTANFENRSYTDAQIKVDGLDEYKMTIDGKEIASGKHTFHPGTHTIVLKYLTKGNVEVEPSVTVETDADGMIKVVEDNSRMLTLDDILYGTRISGASVSPNGGYILVNYTDINAQGRQNPYQRLYDVKNGQFKGTLRGHYSWMPKSEKYYQVRDDYTDGLSIVTVDPATGAESIFATHIPEGNFEIAPSEDYLLYTIIREGPKEDPDIYRIIEPDDRQPGWRDRAYPAIYRLDGKSPLLPLVASTDNVNVVDISDDGRHLLMMKSYSRLTQRPTTLFDLLSLDLTTMQVDTLVSHDGFLAGAYYSPDAKQVVLMGSPEALSRVGCTLPDRMTPSMYDYQLYLMDIADKSVKPLTREFNPSVSSSQWNRYDNRIYMNVTDRDRSLVYVLDPKTQKISPLDTKENVVSGLSLAQAAPIAAWWGQSDSNPDGVYVHNLKSDNTKLIDRPSEARLQDVRIGKCIDWTFKNPKGEDVSARYYLPDNFDPSNKYPLIVNYYGGCTPTTRYFESRYPQHLYSSLGYVMLVIQPSGATGFGQDWSSRHVSTAGQGVADDIIAGTKQFCKEMDFIDPEKIGCIGASYGGFMTQYLQTVTDIFAAAISHAGISDHTSYWGEGYWGYSYSEVSMGEDLPWTNTDLYVKQSPLYNADKVNTPILFLHGDADTNVPVGESIQMYTALKRLGKDTALVQVSDQNHHILKYDQRKKWQDTIFAWFAKYLQDDPTWWEALYPTHNL